MKGDRHYSFKPVEQLLIARLGDQVIGGHAIVKPGTPMFAEFLGEHRRQVARWRSGGVSRSLADRIADRIGLHVYEIWPQMRHDDIEDLPVCARDDCDERFVPGYGRRFCSPRCRQAEKNRRVRAGVDRGPRVCASSDCDETFTPPLRTGPPRIYCSQTCRSREVMRTYRATEAGKLSNRRYARDYKRHVDAARRARQQRQQSEAA
jgi:hypothetical protein